MTGAWILRCALDDSIGFILGVAGLFSCQPDSLYRLRNIATTFSNAWSAIASISALVRFWIGCGT